MERMKHSPQLRDRRVQRLLEERLPQRILLYVFALFLLSLGVVFNVNADLGISPIGVVPFVLSLIAGLSMGTFTFMVFAVLVLLQILILRRDFRWIQLSQIVFAVFSGYFVDFSRFLLGDFRFPTYFGQLLTLSIGMVLIASGIALHMRARIVNLPPAALILAISTKTPRLKFHQVKILLDSFLVLLAIALSFSMLGGLYGVREGTVIAALLIGRMLPHVYRLWFPMLKKIGLETEDAKSF